ncbi:MAG: hypothetical protein KKD24_10970, partial [Proteobacteria bacterium]|nr:hypothetical protein [Pseudomonadota bacterium]
MLMMHNVHHWNMKSRPAIHDNHNITPFLASSQASATDGNFPLCEGSLRDVAACVKKYCHNLCWNSELLREEESAAAPGVYFVCVNEPRSNSSKATRPMGMATRSINCSCSGCP